MRFLNRYFKCYSFLNALGMYEPSKPPPYASMVIVEVFRDKDTQKHEVRFLFRNRTSPSVTMSKNIHLFDQSNDDNETKPYVKYLLGKCDEFCLIEDFEKLTSHLRLSQKEWKSASNPIRDPVIEVRGTEHGLNNEYLKFKI